MSSKAVRVFADMAESQGGYFTVHQATRAGLTHRMLSYYTSAGDLERVGQGIYRWTPFPAHRFGDVIAAVLWAGKDAAGSHETALAVYGLADAMPAVIHVTTPHRFRGRRPGVVVHHTSLSQAEVRSFDDVPVTTPTRTIVDVARESDPSLARQASAEALEHGLLTRRRLDLAVRSAADADTLRTVLDLTPGFPT